jgi:chromosome segregation ATPase
MDNDGLERQLENMEEASERWRAERRRLNAEIDKLETALADAKTAAERKQGQGKPVDKRPGVDPQTLNRIQQAADDKIKKSSEEWEAERAKLNSKINRLEGALAEAIARASNPLRVTQSVKEQFELELNRVAKEKTELEQAFLRAKTEWEQDKLKLTGEAVKLRRAAQIMGRPIPKEDTPDVNPKVRDVENQLREKLNQWNAEREQFLAQIQKLEEASRRWDTERRKLNDHAGQLQQAFMQAEARIQGYEVASRKANPYQLQVEELKRDKDGMEREFDAERTMWENERDRLKEQIEDLQRQSRDVSERSNHLQQEVVDQLRKQYEQRLHDATQQRTQLAQELQNATSLLEAERTRANKAAKGAGGNSGGPGINTAAIEAEISRVEARLSEIIALIGNPNTELSLVIRHNVEKAELDSYLKGMMFTLGKK